LYPSTVVAETLRQRCITKCNFLVDYNNNRFIAEIANDSLPIEKFIFYLKTTPF
jgi:thiaminase